MLIDLPDKLYFIMNWLPIHYRKQINQLYEVHIKNDFHWQLNLIAILSHFIIILSMNIVIQPAILLNFFCTTNNEFVKATKNCTFFRIFCRLVPLCEISNCAVRTFSSQWNVSGTSNIFFMIWLWQTVICLWIDAFAE